MAFEPVHCPTCHGVAVVKYGQTSDGKQRLRCQNAQGECATLIHDDIYQGLLPEVKHKIVDMSLNGSGIRAIARVLQISPSTIMNELKKEPELHHVHVAVCHEIPPEEALVEVHKVEAVELDEMWSFVGKKERQRW